MNKTYCDPDTGQELKNPLYQAKTEVLNAFKVETNKRIKAVRAAKISTTEASLMKQGYLIGMREARRILCRLKEN